MRIRISKPASERRAELIVAAKYLFDKKGVEKTRIQDIVEYIGVAKGVFYYYFASKEEIVQEIAQQIGAEVEAYANAVLKNNSFCFCQKLAAFLDLYISVADQFWADEESLQTGNAEQSMFLPGPNLMLEQLRALFEQGVQNSDINIDFPAQTALVLLLGLKPYVYNHCPNREMIFTISAQMLGIYPQDVSIYAAQKNPVPPFSSVAKSQNY